MSHGDRKSGAPGRGRTCDPRLRRPVLYPTELRARCLYVTGLTGVSAHSCSATVPTRDHWCQLWCQFGSQVSLPPAAERACRQRPAGSRATGASIARSWRCSCDQELLELRESLRQPSQVATQTCDDRASGSSHTDRRTRPLKHTLIQKWFEMSPNGQCRNRERIEIAPLVLDIDEREGKKSLRALEAEHGRLPETLEARTGDSGRHLYFALPEEAVIRNSSGALGKRLDIRGEGGYVVAPPSVHPVIGRPYEWATLCRPASVPGWLVLAAQNGSRTQSKSSNPSRNVVVESRSTVFGYASRRIYVEIRVTAARIPTHCPGRGHDRGAVPTLEGGARRPAVHTER